MKELTLMKECLYNNSNLLIKNYLVSNTKKIKSHFFQVSSDRDARIKRSLLMRSMNRVKHTKPKIQSAVDMVNSTKVKTYMKPVLIVK